MYFLVSGRSIPFIFVPEMKANERDCLSNEPERRRIIVSSHKVATRAIPRRRSLLGIMHGHNIIT
jgi:hypothetical protein